MSKTALSLASRPAFGAAFCALALGSTLVAPAAQAKSSLGLQSAYELLEAALAKDGIPFPAGPVSPAPLMQPGEVYRQVKFSIARIVVSYPVKDRTYRSTGTGFIVDVNGDLATNCHVVHVGKEATGPVTVEVEFGDNPTRLPAKVLGCDAPGDIAVIHVDGLSPDRHPLRFARPGTFDAGDDVIAVGYGLNLYGEPTVSHGIISALHRSLDDVGDLVQTDAAINHGDSGGPLLNMHGEVVGVNSYRRSSNLDLSKLSDAQKRAVSGNRSAPAVEIDIVSGMNYARGAVTAQAYVQKIIATGEVRRVDLGLEIGYVDPDRVHLPRQGVVIKSVKPDSVAARAGFKSGEIIYSITLDNGTTWQTPDVGAFEDALALMAQGRKSTVYSYILTPKAENAAVKQIPVPESEITWYHEDITPTLPAQAAN